MTKKLVQQEGRIELAIAAHKKQKFSSVRELARVYEVPETTLRSRLRGRPARVTVRANCHKLTENEENTLVNWILDLDKRGLPPRHAFVRNMANHLLSQRGSKRFKGVGEKWVTNLVNRRTEIKTRFSRRYDYSRAKCEDPKVIREWFDSVQSTIIKYGILDEDIYNFDETGFAMGLIATTRVITSKDRYGRRKLLQPGNREWVTAIEAVNATGWPLPPYIIFKGKSVVEGWFDNLPADWRLDASDNGWTSDNIAIKWLTKLFIPATDACRKGAYRMLILDGHGSHLTPQFDQICTSNNIIPICMPAHSSHLLQPLDVSCFAVLKREYGRLVEQRMRNGFNHIDKFDFLAAFPDARTATYKASNIQNGFAAAGLVPFDPDRVYQQLNIQLKTPTPPGSSQVSNISSLSQTPYNPRQLERAVSTVKRHLQQRSISPPSPINRSLQRIHKAAESTMINLAILREQYREISAAHEKEKQKRQRSTTRIQHEGGLTREDAQDLIMLNNRPVEAAVATTALPELPTSQPRTRAPQKCSHCGIIGHNILRCPNRNAN
jgi:hypothetical protein